MGERTTITKPSFFERLKLFHKHIQEFNPRTYKREEISDEEVINNHKSKSKKEKMKGRKHNPYTTGLRAILLP